MRTGLVLITAALLSLLSPWLKADDATLHTVIDEHWQWVVSSSPEYAVFMGDKSRSGEWDDASLDNLAARDAALAGFETRLLAIDPNSLTLENGLNRSLLLSQIRSQRAQYELGLPLIAINMRGGPQSLYTAVETLSFETLGDYERWIKRLETVPVRLAQEQAVLAEGIKTGLVQARIIMDRIPAQLDQITDVATADNPFFKPFLNMSANLEPHEQARLIERASSVIEATVVPAYKTFAEFIETEYLPASREEIGLAAVPNGDQLYEFLARRFTTTELTPEQIHQIGLDEVARIRAEMESLIDEIGFDGDLNAFNEFLRTDPQFYYDSPEALLQAYLAVSKRLDPELVSLFGRLPRMPYGVRPIPDQIAPDTTTAYYMRPAADGSRAGFYYVNLYRPEVRPKYEIEVLSVHEAVPGHHLQIALAQELEGLPMFRKLSGPTAFIEGWGLYSERLGYDMGLYRDPYSRYGQLIYDMWRAVRLVVDTGMHYMGWTRDEAIAYFLDNAAKSEADIINEIDRYIGWPGQALAYKIGQLKISELRSRAELTLGDRFDIRDFHDHLLGAGALPLDILEQRMEAWIATY